MLTKTTRKSRPDPRGGRKRGVKRQVRVDLSVQHSINGVKLGPGPVVVPEETAEYLRSQEQGFKRTETFLFQRGSAIIGAGNRLIRMPDHFFDEALGLALQGRGPGLVART